MQSFSITRCYRARWLIYGYYGCKIPNTNAVFIAKVDGGFVCGFELFFLIFISPTITGYSVHICVMNRCLTVGHFKTKNYPVLTY